MTGFPLDATTDRRSMLEKSIRNSLLFLGSTTTTATAAAVTLQPQVANARDELFQPNPLTNAVLEQFRIWDQDMADNIKYNGELESGSAGNKGKVDAYPKLLIPIIHISDDLNHIATMLLSINTSNNQETGLQQLQQQKDDWIKARTILSQSYFEPLAFKKIFNAYGDNIYYNDPDRANVYLGGGATPKNEQSLAYLLRNDVLTNIENLKAELDYWIKVTTTTSNGKIGDIDDSINDLKLYAQSAKDAMDRYMALVPPNELKVATEIMTKGKDATKTNNI